MKHKLNLQALAEKDQLKDIVWAKKQKKRKRAKQSTPQSPTNTCRQ